MTAENQYFKVNSHRFFVSKYHDEYSVPKVHLGMKINTIDKCT